MPDSKKPVRSLEDIDENLNDEDVPTEGDVLREKLKEQSLREDPAEPDGPPEDEPEESSENDLDAEEEAEEKPRGVSKAADLRAGIFPSKEKPDEEEDPLDAGSDEPDYEDQLKAEEEETSAPPAKESTLDDLAQEPISEDSEESIPNLRSQKPQSDVSIPSQIGNYQTPSDYTQNPTRSPFSRYGADRPKKSPKWHLLILALIGIAVIGASIYLLKNQFKDQGGSSSASPSPQASTEPSPSPSPTPSVDRSKFKIRVLNGTSQAGLAASVSAKLKDLGYQTDKTGNATNSAFTRTVVRVKSSATGLLEQLIKDLTFQFDATSAGNLKSDDAADGEVIIGTK